MQKRKPLLIIDKSRGTGKSFGGKFLYAKSKDQKHHVLFDNPVPTHWNKKMVKLVKYNYEFKTISHKDVDNLIMTLKNCTLELCK